MGYPDRVIAYCAYFISLNKNPAGITNVSPEMNWWRAIEWLQQNYSGAAPAYWG